MRLPFAPVRLNIRRRMLLTVMSVSIATLLILSVICFYGMTGAKSTAIEIGQEIGTDAMERSSADLIKQKEKELEKITEDRADDIRRSLSVIIRDVMMLSRGMNKIMESPELYSQRTVLPPDPKNGGILAAQLLFEEGVPDRNAPGLRWEIGLTGNIIDMAYPLMESNPVMATAMAASADGFTVLVDKYSEWEGEYFNSRERPWYRIAKKQAESMPREQIRPVFTDVIKDAINGKLCMVCSMPYYRGNEFCGVVAMGAFIENLEKFVINARDDEQRQFAFVLDDDAHIILSSYAAELGATLKDEMPVDETLDLRDIPNQSLANLAAKMERGEMGVEESVIGGESYYVAYAPIDGTGWSYAAAVPTAAVVSAAKHNEEAIHEITERNVETLDRHMANTMFLMLLFIMLLLITVIYMGRKTSDSFLRPINALSDGVKEIAGGNLDKKLDIRTGDEIQHLAESFNAMTDDLKTYMNNLTKAVAERERIATELSVAAEIQESMLPNEFPPFPERKDFDIFASMTPAKEVGGDFYDFYLVDDSHLMVTMADVSGKGVPAALFMVVAKTVLKNLVLAVKDPNELSSVAAKSNDLLCENNDAMMFVTVFMGMIDLKTGKLSYVNAGHNPPIIYRESERNFSYMQVERNHVMGGIDGLTYMAQEITLAPGDGIFLYTDGVTEALNEEKELFGEERLLSTLAGAGTGAASDSLKGVVAAVDESLRTHTGSAGQSDDITMMALRYKGTAEYGKKGGNPEP